MLSSAVFASSWPAIQEVISFQKEPEPTAPGIWSEPSKTHSVASFWILAKFREVSLGYLLRSTSLRGARYHENCAMEFWKSLDARYVRVFLAASLLPLNSPAMSPPPSTGFEPASLPGIGKTPTVLSRSATTASGKKPVWVRKFPCRYM